MKREIILTKDGSHTISVPEWKVTYHSIHGALEESRHVFLVSGFHFIMDKFSGIEPIRIFEMGFGTGLNTFLTALEAEKKQVKVQYTAIEQYPLQPEEALLLNYGAHPEEKNLLIKLHESGWNTDAELSPYFRLKKISGKLENAGPGQPYHLIYYDAFAPSAQPELWTEAIFRKMHQFLLEGGCLVTYCSKGDVRRAMMAAGFSVTKLPGPPGKREIVRAVKK